MIYWRATLQKGRFFGGVVVVVGRTCEMEENLMHESAKKQSGGRIRG